MALDNQSIADLITTTNKDFGALKWTDISMDLQRYIAMPEFLKRRHLTFSSGTSLQRNVNVDLTDAASMVGLYEVDNVNVGDVMQTIDVPWRHMTTNWAIERREIAMNRTPARIVELIKIRRNDAMKAMVKLVEDQFWSAGPPSSADKLNLWGIFHWIIGKETGDSDYSGAGEFGGTTHGSWSDIAGLNPTVYPNWANWTHTHQFNVAGQEATSVQNMRTASYETDFVSPVPHPNYATKGPTVIYTNFANLKKFETYAEEQNDRLGKDIASMANQAVFMGNRIVAVPKLDANDVYTNPIIGINWSFVHFVCLRGEYLNQSRVDTAPNQHTVLKQHVDTTCNILVDDRRRHWILIQDS